MGESGMEEVIAYILSIVAALVGVLAAKYWRKGVELYKNLKEGLPKIEKLINDIEEALKDDTLSKDEILLLIDDLKEILGLKE